MNIEPKESSNQITDQDTGHIFSTLFKSYHVSSGVTIKAEIEPQLLKTSEMDIENFKNQQISPLTNCLVISKPNSLEFFLIEKGILDPLFELNLNANLKLIEKIQNLNEKPDFLFILTEDLKYRFCQVQGTKQQKVFFKGSINMPNQERLDEDLVSVKIFQKNTSQSEIVGYVCIYAYEQEIKVLPFKIHSDQKFTVYKMLTIRLQQDGVYQIYPMLDLVNQTNNHVLGIIYDSKFQTIEFQEKDSEATECIISNKWRIQTEEDIIFFQQTQIIQGGLLFTTTGVFLYQFGQSKAIKFQKLPGLVQAVCQIPIDDKNKEIYIVGLEKLQKKSGKNQELYMLMLEKNINSLQQYNLMAKYLGETSVSSVLIYLGNKFIFLGSKQDDGQLLQIIDEENQNQPENPYINNWALFSNLGKIYCISSTRNEQSKQLMISSPEKNDSLNLFQKSISLNLLREVSFKQQIKSLFVLNDTDILVSFRNSTIYFQMKSGQLQQITSQKFMQFQQKTIHAFNVDKYNFVQITTQGIYLISTKQVGMGNGIVNIYYFSQIKFNERMDVEQYKANDEIQIEGNPFLQIEQMKKIKVGYQPVQLKQASHLVQYFGGGATQAINCVSSDVSILKCLIDKNEKFDLISINIECIQNMDEILINGIPHIVTVQENNKIQISSLETSQKYHIQQFGKSQLTEKNIKKIDQQIVEESKENCLESIQNIVNPSFSLFKNEIVQIINSKYIVKMDIQEDELSMQYNSRIQICKLHDQEIIQEKLLKDERIYSLAIQGQVLVIGGEVNQQKNDQIINTQPKGVLYVLNITRDEKFSYKSELLIHQIDVNNDGLLLIADPIKNVNVFEIDENEKTLWPYAKSSFLSRTSQSNFYGNQILQSDIDGNIMIMQKDINVQSDLQHSIYIGENITTAQKLNVEIKDIQDEFIGKNKLNLNILGSSKGSLLIVLGINGKVNMGNLGNFIDLDVIKKVQDLKNNQIEQLIQEMELETEFTPNDLIMLIDNIERIIF
ncbi:hypothetical protein PPERSA_00940 [Pseudocohnilembus persalinus]|uniref:RSE1/DDB1/CPSF1 first beta-propeller domain-containing protein n=1 Tax=Pseudocohnilembus persalinus TaxID=266149 RepID=A0A0V0QER7_PSEPJ|nr:hypothetical protein PPERSA_00940 [Pseudocohnilembus persalinus]|eukprot:KRX00713.1 hypothetical protein PPERSA_00940 [Pseudocohnilembus persalinus]